MPTARVPPARARRPPSWGRVVRYDRVPSVSSYVTRPASELHTAVMPSATQPPNPRWSPSENGSSRGRRLLALLDSRRQRPAVATALEDVDRAGLQREPAGVAIGSADRQGVPVDVDHRPEAARITGRSRVAKGRLLDPAGSRADEHVHRARLRGTDRCGVAVSAPSSPSWSPFVLSDGSRRKDETTVAPVRPGPARRPPSARGTPTPTTRRRKWRNIVRSTSRSGCRVQ